MKKIILLIALLFMASPVTAQMGMGMNNMGMGEVETVEEYFNLLMESSSKLGSTGYGANIEIDQENNTVTQFMDKENTGIGKVVMGMEDGKLVNRMYNDKDELIMESYMHQAYFDMMKSYQGKSRSRATGALAQSTLRTLSTASETFATANNGNYPVKMDDLTEATPPYLNKNYCGQEISEYSYTCEMSVKSYKFTATPASNESGEKKSYIISTGGILEEN